MGARMDCTKACCISDGMPRSTMLARLCIFQGIASTMGAPAIIVRWARLLHAPFLHRWDPQSTASTIDFSDRRAMADRRCNCSAEERWYNPDDACTTARTPRHSVDNRRSCDHRGAWRVLRPITLIITQAPKRLDANDDMAIELPEALHLAHCNRHRVDEDNVAILHGPRWQDRMARGSNYPTAH